MTKYDQLVADFTWDIPETYNLGSAASDLQVEQGHHDALILVDEQWRETRYSFRYLSENSARLANLLVGDGFKEGDRIAVILPASVEAAVAHIGILKAGMISVPVLLEYKSEAATERLSISGAAAVFTTSEIAEVCAAAWSSLEGLRKVYVISNGSSTAPPRYMADLLAAFPSHFIAAATKSTSPALLGFTSGSEGRPKGVLHKHSVVLGGQPSLLFSETPQAGHIVWSHFEWGWLGGLLVALGAWHYGSAILVHDQANLVPKRTLELWKRVGVNHVSIAPTAIKMFRAAARSSTYPKLTSITSGGEKLDADTREWVQAQFGIPLSEIYGLSECGAVLGSGYVLPIREGAIGKPPPGQNVHIISHTGEKLANNQTGFIAVQAPHPSLFLGYWGDQAATDAKFVGGLFNTGDVGYQDDDGYFWYVSRGDDLISVAGHRVGPAEIEDIFVGFPEIELCAAVGVPNSLSGEAVVLWVQVAPDHEASSELLEAIFSHAREMLPPYQIPQRVRFVEKIPLTPTGKVHRRAVREREIAEA
jgi:acetyl-CoA synthetase